MVKIWQHTLLLIDQEMYVGVDGDDDDIGKNISSTDQVQSVWIVHRYSFRDLHHPEDDDKIGTLITISFWKIFNDNGLV